MSYDPKPILVRAPSVDALLQAIDNASAEIELARREIQTASPLTGVHAEEPGSALVAIASMGQAWMRFQVAIMNYERLIAQRIEEMDARRKEAEEKRLVDDRKRADDRERWEMSITLENKRETRAIKLATVVLAFAALIQTLLIALQAWAMFHPPR